MRVIYADNPDFALQQGLRHLAAGGEEEHSRNGPVLVSDMPVTTVYVRGYSTVSLSAARDANPFFHVMEALWMLAGRNDTAFPAAFAANLAQYSDDGRTLNGAYGHRWRRHFGYDQLEWIVDTLRGDPQSRRCVLAMWDPGSTDSDGEAVEGSGDLFAGGHGSKDIPCNTHVYFRLHETRGLDMTVCNRSNDIVWGAYGANVVHMGFMHAFVAGALNVPRGNYYQVSNNYHAYVTRPDTARLLGNPDALTSELRPHLKSVPLFDDNSTDFLTQCEDFCINGLDSTYASSFLNLVAVPMLRAHREHKAGHTQAAMYLLDKSIDWHYAGFQWLARRQK